MNAEELFYEIGYKKGKQEKKNNNIDGLIHFTNEDRNMRIVFFEDAKSINVASGTSSSVSLTENCLKAIFKQCQELGWFKLLYGKPIYKLTKFEYDLLRTNDMAKDKTLNDFATYKNLQTIGYFKNIDFNLKIEEVLENCEAEP